jgi:methionine aminopeptidase
MTSEIIESFEKTRIAGSIAAGALDEVSKIIKPGIYYGSNRSSLLRIY